jgi:hypothetical protein
MRPILVIFVAACMLSGCANQTQIRDPGESGVMPDPQEASLQDCSSGSASTPQGGGPYTVENYPGYSIGFTEFDDQGWTSGKDDASGQIQTIMGKLDTLSQSSNVLVVVFVHGWHHNAHDNDCYVREFRGMVRELSERYAKPAGGPDWKVFGLYVGWRGESIPVPGARELTIFSRKFAAERVAKGSVRELFARLKLLESHHRQGNDLVRTIVTGHSFGGLIAFHSLSQSLLEDIVFGKVDCHHQAKSVTPLSQSGSKAFAATPAREETWAFPDLLVLINPAFEASRYQPLVEAARLPDGCSWEQGRKPHRPRIITITAKNDEATGVFFPMFRWLGTLSEQYNEAKYGQERKSNLKTIGFVDDYQTHTMELCPEGDGTRVVLKRTGTDPQTEWSPLVVASAPPEILDGHDGFLFWPKTGRKNPLLVGFIGELYTLGQGHVMGGCGSKAKPAREGDLK